VSRLFQSVQLESMLKNEAPKLTIAQFQYEVVKLFIGKQILAISLLNFTLLTMMTDVFRKNCLYLYVSAWKCSFLMQKMQKYIYI